MYEGVCGVIGGANDDCRGNRSTRRKPAQRHFVPPQIEIAHLVPGALSLDVKRLGHEADNSPPTSGKVKKTWLYTSTPP
jgi:hypothetical protein